MTSPPGRVAARPGGVVMRPNDATTPTMLDYIDAGLRNGVSLRRSLANFRQAGGRVRTEDFLDAWHARRREFEAAARKAAG